MERNERIRQLIETGEAVDEKDAREALWEEVDTAFFRSVDGAAYCEEAGQKLRDSETDPIDRWDLKFRKAVIEVGETPDELEFLWYQALLDLPTAEPRDEAARRRIESTRRRLKRKTEGVSVRLGNDRCRELFDRYRIRLQELFDESEPE